MKIGLANRQILGLVVGVLVARFFVFPALFNTPEDVNHAEEKTSRDNEALVEAPNPFNEIEIQAAAAIVFDIKTREVMFAKNESVQLPLASLTKLMTGLIAIENLENSDLIRIESASLQQEGNNGFFIGELFKPKDLIDFTLVASSNDGAHALANALSALPDSNRRVSDVTEVMNKRAKELGLNQTYFTNETGLDVYEALVGGGYGSAIDVSRMLSYIVAKTPELIEATQKDSITIDALNGLSHTAKNTNILTNKIPWLVGSKTGYTDLAGGNLAVVFDAGLAHPIVAVVLGSTMEERFSDMQNLVETTFDYLETQP